MLSLCCNFVLMLVLYLSHVLLSLHVNKYLLYYYYYYYYYCLQPCLSTASNRPNVHPQEKEYGVYPVCELAELYELLAEEPFLLQLIPPRVAQSTLTSKPFFVNQKLTTNWMIYGTANFITFYRLYAYRSVNKRRSVSTITRLFHVQL